LKAILLAAGYGTRLRPLTESVPKCLVPIHGKPLLGYWLDLLLTLAVERVLINTHYLPDVVRDYVQESDWRNQIELSHEEKLLGTGGTLIANRDFIQNDAILVAHADNLTLFDPSAFLAKHAAKPHGVQITMMTFDTDVPESCGIVELDDQGLVIAFHEKKNNPPGRLANAAVYIFEPEVVKLLISLNKEEPDISLDVIPHFLGKIQTFHNDKYHRDIGSLESLQQAENEFGKYGI
jgi:mannose-1-phosphate guanylyltransferase